MPTLRNKTTDKGAIIRWKPHPNHARPSTYQVTPRAISFLRELGYHVPSPGDEVSIPAQVCRPLRLLGDLYFESESQDDVELGNHPGRGYYQSSGLSTKQLDQIRSYVESHPSYIGGFRRELEKELSELPGVREETPRPVLDPDSQNIRRLSNGNVLLPKPFYFGQVDRKSNKGNAMLSTASGNGVNLGKLPPSVVGEWTVGVSYRGIWTMCLAPQQWSSGYRKSVQNYLDQLEELSGLESLRNVLNVKNRHYGKDIHGCEVDVRVCYSGHGLGVGYHGEWIILVDSELATAGQRISVKVKEVYGTVGIAVPKRPGDERALSTGDQVKLTVDKVGKNLIVGTYDGQLVTVPRETNVVPEQILVAISEVNDGYVTGTVNTLDETERPSVGDTLAIQEGRIEGYPSIPIDLPETTLPDSVRVRLPAITINTDSISVSAKFYENIGLFGEGERITSSSQQVGERGLLITMNDLPVVVNGGRYVPGIDVQVRPTGCSDGFVEAEFERFILPIKLQSVEHGYKFGNEKLRDGKFQQAIQALTGAVEMTDKTEAPEQWLMATLQEILAVVARALVQEDTQEALRYLSIRKEMLNEEGEIKQSLTNTVSGELSALSRILEAKSLLDEAKKMGGRTDETEARRDAKGLLDDATSQLEDLLPLAGHERPHWLVNEQLKQTADNLLILSPSVKRYLADLETREA